VKRVATTALVGSAVAAVIAAAAGPAVALTTAAPGTAPAASTSTTATAAPGADKKARPDNRPGPLTKTWVAQRKAALDLVGKGKATADANGVVRLGKGKAAETTTTKTDKIFTVLAEFGDQGSGKYGTVPGPLHNQIAQPDRAKDNSTYWVADFSKAYYETFFNGTGESMKDYYEKLSNGKYSVVNTVSDWVKVPYNESFYGDNAVEDLGGSWRFISDTGNAWYDAQLAAGKTPADIDAYLAQFDVWDRYDFDHDGSFNEPDGYIDHFQAVHAGMGEDAGGGAQGEDAIWSHRWYVNGTDYGLTGPSTGGTSNLMGGARIGQSKYWLGDYTTEPENGGLGVFAHEFGHDLGLPDFYDTADGENSTSFWTLMSSGSWLNHGQAAGEGIGVTPGLMGPEEKYFLGWLDGQAVPMGESGEFTLNPSQFHEAGKEQAVRIDLPSTTVDKPYTTPASGSGAWWTGTADGLNESLSRPVEAASRVTVTAKSWYDIESGYDFLYGEYSLDNGESWQRVGSPVSGSSNDRWTTLRYSYDAGGQPSLFRFRYQTDGGVHLPGAFLDDVTITAGSFTDDVEHGANGWDATGRWTINNGTVTNTYERYYLVENRQYQGWDKTLAEGPYQFSKGITAPNWVEFFTFQNGMLVWYVDDSFEDNNTIEHPGGGASLPVDLHPEKFVYPDGTAPSNRRQPFDATFNTQATDDTCLHKEVVGGTKKVPTVETLAACAPSRPGVALFDDTNPVAYWSDGNPLNSVKVNGHGVKVTVLSGGDDDLLISVVNPAKKAGE
jgi:immune inhibitor A